jgi:serine/threonine protein kinase
MRADEVKPEVPIVVADIIDKLLEKSPSDRYQSANGLSADLDRCIHALARLDDDGSESDSLGRDCIEPFSIGQNDLSGTFRIPPKLYDRERDIKIVLDAFDRVRMGAKEVVTVHGPSGIGKVLSQS